MDHTKRRSHTRVPAGVTVTVLHADGTTSSAESLRNVSLGGVFIAMSEALAFGTEVGLQFVLPVQGRSLRCKGLVVWTSKDHPDAGADRQGIGVRLMEISAGDMRLLASFIESHLPL